MYADGYVITKHLQLNINNKTMKNQKSLSRSEMKEIKGGVSGGCLTSEYTTDTDCKDSKYGPKCQASTCIATGKPANYCVSASWSFSIKLNGDYVIPI